MINNTETNDNTPLGRLTAAFFRLKINEPKIVPKGSKVNVNKVQEEAGLPVGSLREVRYPQLFKEVKNYKKNVGNDKSKEQCDDAQSELIKTKVKLKESKRKQDKHYNNWKNCDEQLKNMQTKEVQILKAMFDLLPNEEKDKLIGAGVNEISKTKVVKMQDIKKVKSTTRKR